MSEKVIIYSMGVCHCSVCAVGTMTAEEVSEAVNAESPTQIESKWTVSEDKTFGGGQPNPCICEDDDTRKHWLMVC